MRAFRHSTLILLLLWLPLKPAQAQSSREEAGQYIREIDELLANISQAFKRWEKSLDQPNRQAVSDARSQLAGWVYHARTTMENKQALPEDPGFLSSAKAMADFMHKQLHDDDGLIWVITRYVTANITRTDETASDHKLMFGRLVRDLQGKEGRVQFMRIWLQAKLFDTPPPASFCAELGAMGASLNSIFQSYKGELLAQPHTSIRDYALTQRPAWALGGTATLSSGYPVLRFLCHSTADSSEALGAVQSLIRQTMLCSFAEFNLGWVEYGANLYSTRDFWVKTSMTYKMQNYYLAATLVRNETSGKLETYLEVVGKSKLPE